jgi:hypothetical protein
LLNAVKFRCTPLNRAHAIGLLLALALASVSSEPLAQTSADAATVRPGLLAYVQETARGTFEL